MINKNKNFKFAAFEVVVPSLKNFNYGQKFLIMSFVPSFYQNYFPREKKLCNVIGRTLELAG